MVNNCVLFMLYTINEESCKILYFRFEQETDTVLTFSFSLLLFMHFSFTYYPVFVVQYNSSYLFNYVIKQKKYLALDEWGSSLIRVSSLSDECKVSGKILILVKALYFS